MFDRYTCTTLSFRDHYIQSTYAAFTYIQVKKVRSKDKDAIQKYEECNKIVKWMAFQKAIAVDTTYRSVADSINLDTIGTYVFSVVFYV